MNTYFVYELIDPRNNQCFYIGKGKDNRHLSHEKENFSVHMNFVKINIINEILNSGECLKYNFIAENLSEDAAFLLERILIYRIGRSIFNEGVLTNIVPGGKYNKDAPLFLKETDIPSDAYLSENFPELIPVINKYPKISKDYKGLECPSNPNDELIHVFNRIGEKLYSWDIVKFNDIFGLSKTVELLKCFGSSDLPIYLIDRQWCKCDLTNVTINISSIPYEDFDEIDISFSKKIDLVIEGKLTMTIISEYNSENLRFTADFKTGHLQSFKSFYKNGTLKYSKSFDMGVLNGLTYFYFDDGKSKDEILYNMGKIIESKSYFRNGNIEKHNVLNAELQRLDYKTWHENGLLASFQNANDDFETYYEDGKLQSVGNYRNGISKVFYNNGKIKLEMDRKDSQIIGIHKEYYDTGELKKTTDYSNGRDQIITTQYLKNGEIKVKQ